MGDDVHQQRHIVKPTLIMHARIRGSEDDEWREGRAAVAPNGIVPLARESSDQLRVLNSTAAVHIPLCEQAGIVGCRARHLELTKHLTELVE